MTARYSFAARVGGTAIVLAALPRERRAAFAPTSKIHAVRDSRLRALVRFAAEHVPHYRDLFAELGIVPADVASTDDLVALPVLEKETVQRAPDRFRPPADVGLAMESFPTSGSSGTPLVVSHESAALLRYLAVGRRHGSPVRRVLGRGRLRRQTIARPNSTGVRARDFYRRATLLPPRPDRRLSPDASPETVAATIDARRPDVLAGLGNTLEELFRLADAGAVRFHLPRLVSYHSDAMSDAGRRLIEDRFGIPVFSSYGAVETFQIGFFCERRTGHHLHEDCCHVRVVRPDGADAAPGEAGEVVVSNLVNRGMVLLNYRLGDVAALLADECACGRSLRLLSPVQGRINEVVVLTDGTRVHPFSVADAVREEGLLRFRLVQAARMRFRLEVVTVDDEAYRRVLDAAVPRLCGVLGGAEVTAVRRVALEEGPRQKFRRVVALPDDA
ncbi:MAG: hypothetical protein M3321_09305 [Actinomycetota bacterium]|nr:hypothetical protein [Actinomycetota bacterium]